VLGTGVGVACALGGWPVALGLPQVAVGSEAGSLGADYLRVRTLGAPLLLTGVALSEARYALGDARSPMVAAVTGNLVNLALDPLFIFGLELGVVGAAWATMIAEGVTFGLLARVTLRRGPRPGRPGSTDFRQLAAVGLPMGLQFLLEVGSFAALVAILARISEVDLAAHQVALQLCHFSFLPALALGEAASVLVSQAIGARADALVRKVAHRALLAATAYTGLCGLLFAVGASFWASLFSADERVQQLTVRLLYVAATFQVFDGAHVVARCALRGSGDVRYPAVVSVLTAWVCTPPLALGLGVSLGLGALGARRLPRSGCTRRVARPVRRNRRRRLAAVVAAGAESVASSGSPRAGPTTRSRR
jgi:MATE family multidrug resistance protein